MGLGAIAYVNLIDRKQATSPNEAVVLSASGANSEAFASASPDATLKSSSFSENATPQNITSASANFTSRFNIIGNTERVTLPLDWNFELDGILEVGNPGVPSISSIAYIKYTANIISDKSNTRLGASARLQGKSILKIEGY